MNKPMNINLGNTKLEVPPLRWYDSRADYPVSNDIVLTVMSATFLGRSKSVQSTVSRVDSEAHTNRVLRGPKPGTVDSG
jgi:hypothetical protein